MHNFGDLKFIKIIGKTPQPVQRHARWHVMVLGTKKYLNYSIEPETFKPV